MKKVTKYRITIKDQSFSALETEIAKEITSFLINHKMIFTIERVEIPNAEITK